MKNKQFSGWTTDISAIIKPLLSAIALTQQQSSLLKFSQSHWQHFGYKSTFLSQFTWFCWELTDTLKSLQRAGYMSLCTCTIEYSGWQISLDSLIIMFDLLVERLHTSGGDQTEISVSIRSVTHAFAIVQSDWQSINASSIGTRSACNVESRHTHAWSHAPRQVADKV